MIKIVIAGLLSAALIILAPQTQAQTPSQLNNSTRSAKAQTVQAQLPRKVTTGVAITAVAQEKAPTEPPTVVAKASTVSEVEPKVLSPHEELMQQAGIPQSEWSAVNYIVSHESSWRPSARNAQSGAYGLCQALPASKMASAGDDYMTNPVTQLRWCHSYATNRYHGWWSSFAFWKANRWW